MNLFHMSDDENRWGKVVLGAVGIGFVCVACLGYTSGGGISGILVALFLGAAAMSIGGLLGFLFGIPRAIQEPRKDSDNQSAFATNYVSNTNLEEISRWLTATIVGLTLVQAETILGKFDRVCLALTDAFPEASTITAPLVGIVLVYFSVTGGVGSYLWTRLMLMDEFRRVELRARQSPEYLEGLIDALLYQPPPKGFRAAQQYCDEYLKVFGEDNWRIYRAMACAYGQQYLFMRDHGSSQDEMRPVRDRAYNAVMRAVELNSQEKDGLRLLWDPKRATPQENDLVVFHDDKGFRTFFGEVPTLD